MTSHAGRTDAWALRPASRPGSVPSRRAGSGLQPRRPGRSPAPAAAPLAAALLVMALALFAPAPLAAQEVRAVPSATYPTIQSAIDASSRRDTVKVQSTSFDEALTLDQAIVLVADLAGGGHVVVRLPADTTAAVLRITAAPDPDPVVVSGFAFLGGKGWSDAKRPERYGGAVVVDSAAAAILVGCRLDSSEADWGGGLAVMTGGAITLRSTVIDTNRAFQGGGGIYVAGRATLDSVTVTGNVVADSTGARVGFGGGILVGGGGADTLRALDVRRNRAEHGGGLAARDSAQVTLTRTVVADNEASELGGGLYLEVDAAVSFLTVDSNTARTGGGVHVDDLAQPTIRNTIISRNEGQGIACGGATLGYNDRWGNMPDDLATCPLGAGSIVADPRFLGGEPFDHHLDVRSPCIDAADPAAEVPTDGGVRADIGAFEFRAGPEIRSVTIADPDSLYKESDTIRIDVSGLADASVTVTVTGDFSSLGGPQTVTGTPQAAEPPATFASRLLYQIQTAPPTSGEEAFTVIVTATTSLGGATMDSVQVVLDSDAPDPPTIDPLPAGTENELLTVTGTAPADADSVAVQLGGAFARGAATGEDGGFAITVTLTERHNTITATAFDRVGNESEPSAAQSVAFVPSFFVEFPKRFSPGNQFTIGWPSSATEIRITIVNLAGQVVRTLDGGGSKVSTVTWDGANGRGDLVNAGPYVARFEIRDLSAGTTRIEHHALVFAKGGGGP